MLSEQIKEANKLRKAWAESDAKRDAYLPTPDVDAIYDISYTTSETKVEEIWHLTDIYYPKNHNNDKKLPVIVSVHGGGWFYGDKRLYSLYTKHLAEKGYAVVNFNYRLAPEYKYPCGFSDVCRLMDFVQNNAEKYCFDIDRLFMVGDSAGAQLVNQYCVYATNNEYKKLFPEMKDINSPIPYKVALNCGVYKTTDIDDPEQSWYLKKDMTKEEKESVGDILGFMNKDFPESFVMISVNDGLAPCTDALLSRLAELQIPHIFRKYGESDKGAGHVFHIDFMSREGERCNNDEIGFFRS